jgi:hypothetical protein
VVRSVLRVIFDDDDQGVVRVRALSHGLDQQADSVVVISLLQFRSVDSSKRRPETTRVIVAEATDHLERWRRLPFAMSLVQGVESIFSMAGCRKACRRV